MIATFSAVFVASLLGSTHCAGMCGAFLAVAVAPSQTAEGSRLRARAALLSAYNAGRLITYTILGVIAGAVGAAVDLGGSLVGVQRGATIAAGVFILAFGLIAVLRHLNVPIRRAPLPKALQNAVIRGHRIADRLPPFGRALTVGLLTTLLPCGWLWAFVVTAAGAADPLLGGFVMAAFWLGTLPVMASLGMGIQTLAGRLGSRLPLVTSILLVVIGLYTVAGRLALPAVAMPMPHVGADGAVAVPDPDEPPPCPLCDPGEKQHGG
jgi:sulfite exporter TauE/SafE